MGRNIKVRRQKTKPGGTSSKTQWKSWSLIRSPTRATSAACLNTPIWVLHKWEANVMESPHQLRPAHQQCWPSRWSRMSQFQIRVKRKFRCCTYRDFILSVAVNYTAHFSPVKNQVRLKFWAFSSFQKLSGYFKAFVCFTHLIISTAKWPKAFDVSQKLFMTEFIILQKECGGCWSFAAVSVVEYWMWRSGRYEIYSEQNLIDCVSSCSGCDGERNNQYQFNRFYWP